MGGWNVLYTGNPLQTFSAFSVYFYVGVDDWIWGPLVGLQSYNPKQWGCTMTVYQLIYRQLTRDIINDRSLDKQARLRALLAFAMLGYCQDAVKAQMREIQEAHSFHVKQKMN